MRRGIAWVRGWFGELWGASRALTGLGLAMVGSLAIAVVGLAVDPRMIEGSPAWLKPAKFAISTGVYCLTIAWIFTRLGRPSRVLSGAGVLIAGSLAIELVLVGAQAARGTTSHFNIATPLDAAIFGTMGVMILVLLASSAVIAALLMREGFDDRATGWSIRLGMLLTVVGSTTGGLMLRPTSAQVEAAKISRAMPIVGGHHVGEGVDGDASPLPLTGWSRTRGDLRVPHFVGLHAIQAVPALAWLALMAMPGRSDRARLWAVAVIAASYALLLVGLTLQAVAGISAFAWHGPSVVVGLAWLLTTALALVAVRSATAHASLRPWRV